jgi:DNA-directed RNA polymerase subunit beta'
MASAPIAALKESSPYLSWQLIVVEPGLTDLKKGEIISEEHYIDYQDEYGEDSFSAAIGAEAIEQMLLSIDLEADYNQLKIDLTET